MQDGETIPFCACVHTGDTTLYHDTESQVLLAELDYPVPVENAEQRYLGMETADRNGDGSSDILLRFSLGEPSFKQFVIVSGSDPPPEHEIRRDEKNIILLPDGIRPEAFSYTRPVIFAIRQENGTHRFFARK